TLEYGRALRGHAESKGRFRVFGTNGPIGWHDEALCPHPSVIIGRKGAYRGVHYSPAPFFVIDTAFYLEPKSEIDVRWAYYELLTQDINGMDSGSAIPSTSREAFYNLPVRVPPLTEQRAIAHILGTLDDKIELNRRMSETLEAMARALFKAWFVDFEPVRAKMEGRWGKGESLPGLPAHLYDLFPDRLVDSELGEIPEGWKVGTIGDIAEVSSGKRPDVRLTDSSEPGAVPLWGGNGPMGFVPEPLVDEPILITGRVGTLGSVFRVTKPCWPSDNTLVLRPKREDAFEYLFLRLRRIDLESLNRGSTLVDSDRPQSADTPHPYARNLEVLQRFRLCAL
ncbi:MAG: restriction endonuclease subunit S, partial [Nitrospira sp.]|nr:restriction endonuclease subunit S [Nitrospira sp.]